MACLLVVVIQESSENEMGDGKVGRKKKEDGHRQIGTALRPARVRAMMDFMICAVPSPI